MARAVRTPIVQQMERTECGAACLGIILGYYGRWIDLDQLRIDCGVSRDGSRAGNMVRAARNHGLEANGFEMGAAETGGLQVPFIAFWGHNHFVVVENVGRGGARINDPAVGRRHVSRREYDRDYAGIVLCFDRADRFQPAGVAPSLTAALRRRFAGQGAALWFILAASVALAIPGIFAPSFTKLFTDYFLVKRFDDWLIPLLAAMAAVAALQGGLTWLQQRYLLRMETRLSVGGVGRLMRRMITLPMPFFSQRSPSELAVRVTQPESLAQLLAGNLGTAALGLPAIVLFAAVMLAFDPVLGGLCIGIAGIDMLALAFTARVLAERNQAVMIQQTRVTAAAAGGLRMIGEYKASGSETLLFNRITGLKARQENLNGGFVRVRYALLAIPVAVQGLTTATLLTVGGMRVISGSITEGVLIAFQALVGSFIAPVSQLVSMGQQVQNARAYVTQIDDAMRQAPAVEFAGGATLHPTRDQLPVIGGVTLEDIRFGYSALEPPLIEGLNIAIAPAEWVAIVGPSGCGKSTVAKLVAGLETPWDGTILVDGRPLSETPRTSLRGALAVVDQNVVLFEGTIRDNIAMWDPTMTDETIVAAAKLACAHDFITARPAGYEAKLSEEGANLSGGQRALIDLARAIALRPAVLVLDEATAALDALTEAKVMENLRQLGCTVILIAHRLSTVRDADRILVMQAGQIVETGTHERLMQQQGAYCALVSQP